MERNRELSGDEIALILQGIRHSTSLTDDLKTDLEIALKSCPNWRELNEEDQSAKKSVPDHHLVKVLNYWQAKQTHDKALMSLTTCYFVDTTIKLLQELQEKRAESIK